MSLSPAYIADVEQRLAAFSPTLPAAFQAGLAIAPERLTDEALTQWAEEGVALAGHSPRSSGAAVDFFETGSLVRAALDATAFRAWAAAGRDLADLSAGVASAYFRASPASLGYLSGVEIDAWARLGQRLYKGSWKSISLASDFFSQSPVLLASLPLSLTERLVRVIESISERSAELAAACLDSAAKTIPTLDRQDRVAFLGFAASVAETAWPEANLYFQKGGDLLHHVDFTQRSHYLDLSSRVAGRIGRQAYTLFAEGATALRDIAPMNHRRVLGMADQLLPYSPVAAMGFIRAVPVVMNRLKIEELGAWHEAGLAILAENSEGGEAYFRLESIKAEQVIANLSARVDLGTIGEILRLYGKALTGADISVHPIEALEEKGIGWVSERGPSTEGTAVYLPDFMEEYTSKAENFAAYKVYATHQTAHLEFGSFWFSYRREGIVLPRRRHLVEDEMRARGRIKKETWLTDMERFFDLFPERQLGSDIFTLLEDARIDGYIKRDYSGIRGAVRRAQVRELDRRPEVRAMPLLQAFVENLVRATLDGEYTIRWPAPLRPTLLEAIRLIGTVRGSEATVEDTAEATLLLYDIAVMIPNLASDALQEMNWDELSQEDLEMLAMPGGLGEGSEPDMSQMPTGEEEPYESPDQVDFRGDFKPEMVQLLMRLRMQEGEGDDDSGLSPLTAEELRQLLEKSVEIDISSMTEGELSESVSVFMSNLEKEAGTPIPENREGVEAQGSGQEPEPVANLSPEIKTFYYDEWDFRAADYKPRWCAVRERILTPGTEEFFEKTLREHAVLAEQIRRQFEQLRPDTFRKLKHLEDGEDIDLDAAIDFVVQKRSGHGDNQKIYWRRNKIERDVAVAFLIDMSASTDEEIEKRRTRPGDDDDFQDDPRRYFQWLSQRRAAQSNEPPKRIIDLEKESLVLLTRALEAIGDSYGIYGFSGYGRDNVEYFVIKDLGEPFSDEIRRRVDKVSPIRSTRMGPAIRHTAAKLMDSGARAKILFLVSDGRPQDHGYGRDRTEKEYAIHDTHKALVEAKHKGILPFALTVDKEGHDYLGQMCGDMNYEILGDIEALPSRLPTLYRRLTE